METQIFNNSRSGVPQRVVVCCVGLVLLAAAALKAYPLIIEPPPLGWGRMMGIMQVLIEWGMGLWLLNGVYAQLARWAALVAFTAFAGVSLYQALRGADDCGCFGPVPVNPWYTFTLDIGIVLLLLLKPRGIDMTRPTLRISMLVILFILTAFPLGVMMAIAQAAQTQPAPTDKQVPQIITGKEPVDLAGGAQVCDLGYLVPGGVYPVVITLNNSTAEPIAITETKAQCGCTTVTGTPENVKPRASAELHFTFAAPDKVMEYGKKITLLLEGTEAKSLDLTIKARLGLPLTTEPTALAMVQKLGQVTNEQQLTVINDGEEDIRLLYATTDHPGVTAIVPREPVPAKGQQNILVKFTEPVSNIKQSTCYIRIHTASDNQPVLSIPAELIVESPE